MFLRHSSHHLKVVGFLAKIYKKLNQKLEDTYKQWINTEEKIITKESKKFFKDKDGIARSEHTKEEFMKKLDILRGVRKQFE